MCAVARPPAYGYTPLLRLANSAAARAAYVASALNLLASLAMVTVLRPGLPSADSTPTSRLAYIVAAIVPWSVGWLLWHAAALSLLAFYVALAIRWWDAAPIRCAVAVLCATAGFAADISAEALYIGFAPHLDAPAFAVFEPIAGLLTGYVGNGLYTVAGALLTWAGSAELPRRLIVLSLPVWLAGAALSAATLAGSAFGQLVSTAIIMPCFILWSALIGRWLARPVS